LFFIYRLSSRSLRNHYLTLSLFNAYSMSAQTNIIAAIKRCLYIFVVNALRYFYQWAIKFNNRHKLTIISHKKQKQFNVCVMNFKIFSFYVQRQTDLMLKNLRDFAKAYMNDIMIFFKILNDHFMHLRAVFERLWHYNVALNLKKIFLDYSSIVLLEQIVNASHLITAKEKLATIANLAFSISLKELKTYLDLTNYIRVYVSWYAQVFLLLQNRKILLLKSDLIKEKSRKVFVRKKTLKRPIEFKIRSYEHLQNVFSKESFLSHFDQLRKLFIDVNISKKRNVGVMIFHVKKYLEEDIIFKRIDIKSIMFVSKILTSAETRYWLIELKMTDVTWMTKKVRHLIKSSKKQFAIIFTNHVTLTNIIKQTFLTFSNTNKLNLRLMKVFQYLSNLSIEIRVKSGRFHVIFDALSRLFSITNKNESQEKNEILKNFKIRFERFSSTINKSD
jgi:hypothetical protein